MLTVRDAVVRLLRHHGMTTWFGNPGSTELPFLAGLPPDFRYVLGLNEAVATGMADGHARATGRPALVNLHTAPGLGNSMGALVNARAAHSPVVVVVGQQVRALLPSGAMLSNPHPTMLPAGAVKFAAQPGRAADVPAVLAQAIHLAMAEPPGPVCVSVPMDDWQCVADPVTEPIIRRTVVGGSVLAEQAAAALWKRVAAASAPVLVVGPQLDTPRGYTHVPRLAERLGAPVRLSAYGARCGFPTAHPAFRGMLPAGAASMAAALAGHDLILALGCPVFTFYPHDPAPLPENAELVAVSTDPEWTAQAVAGDAYLGAPDAAAQMLADSLPDRGRALPVRIPAPAPAPAVPDELHAEEIFDILASVLPADAVVVNETIRQLPQFFTRVPLTQPASFHLAGAIGLGFALPAAVGVGLATPGRPVVAVVGDGSMQYTVQALFAAVAERVPIIVVVLNNHEYAILKDWGQRLGVNDVPGLDLPAIDQVAIAGGYGIRAMRVNSGPQLRVSLERALAGTDPVVIDVALAAIPHWEVRRRDRHPGALPQPRSAHIEVES